MAERPVRDTFKHHHILHSKRQWRAQEPTRELRENQWLKPPLYDDAHDRLHRAVGVVPLPDHAFAESILNRFKPVYGDYFASVDNLLFAIEGAAIGRHIDGIQRELGHLMIQAIDLQKPFIKEGIVYGNPA